MKDVQRLKIKFNNGGIVEWTFPIEEDYKKYLDKIDIENAISIVLQKYPAKDFKKKRII